MPQIVDFAYGYSTSTSGTTVACDTPTTPTTENAILVAVCSSDTGANNWSCSGWAQYYGALANTPGSALLWRAVTGSEAASYTFTSSAAETLNVTILSIIDVNSSSPFDTYAETSRASYNDAFPTFSAAVANELLLFISTHGSLSVQPSSIEGPVTQLWSWDGTAHADSIGWTIHPTTGTTPSTVKSSVSGATYNGKLITVGIKPPTGGASIIPAYCAGDSSVYVDPLHGTTPFGGNSSFAATATTYFGTTINSKTLANASASSRGDVGINTYRSCAGLTSSTNRTWLGAAAVLAAGNVLTTAADKNILAHVMPYLPADMQTLEGVGLGRGVAFGAYSSANNFKIWHVHGANTPWGIKRVPVIINTGNTVGVKQSTGTLNANSIAGFGFFSSGFTVSADMVWTMLWVLDTTTVCGGNATYPVRVPDVVRVVADGHERISALQQGEAQMLLLQPVQLGDGTKPTYVDLSNSAIEFPTQHVVESGQIFYCSTDNVAGITIYAASGDTYKLSNAVFSSKSKFHLRFHASSSAGATIPTSGMQVIGAGDVQLRAAHPIDNAAFANCPTITQNSCTISNSSFTDSKITSATLADMDNITGSSFTSSGTGHAIEVGGSASTITFTGNTFTGYASSNGSTGNEAIYVNIASGTVTLNISGGSTPSIRTAGATVNVVSDPVTIGITVKNSITKAAIQYAHVYLIDVATKAVVYISGETDANGYVSTTLVYSSDIPVMGWARQMDLSGTDYTPKDISGTITSTGFTLTVELDPTS